MFCSLTFVVCLFGVFNVTWGQILSEEKVTDEKLAEQYLEELDGSMTRVFSEAVHAWWNYAVNITEETSRLSSEASLRVEQFKKESCKNASRFDWKQFTDPSITRRFRKVLSECSHLTDDEITKLDGLKRNMTTTYSTAQICKSDTASGNTSCISQNPGLIRLTATSRDWEELLWAWEGWRNVSGKKMKPSFTEMVVLLNKDAKLQGHRDFGKYWQSVYEMENFSSACEELWQQVKPLYQQLHFYVRRKLMRNYSPHLHGFPSTGHIPAHILGNIWAQTWDNILDLVKPYPNSSAIDVTKILKDQGFTPIRMFREAESFFTSLGLPEMPQEFWDHSLIEKPKDGRKVICHASAWDFNNKRDFRIKQCTDVTGQSFATTHHEMGHIQYFINYKEQPVLFRDGANPGFHEAVGDAIALSVNTPQHLRKINLLNDTTDNCESEMNFLMKTALERVAFLPFGYLIDRWRWEVFDGTITPENYNSKYWKLRCELQGISPPVPRSEEDFDIGAKFHIGRNAEYISYFLSYIIQFQFHKSLCQAAGHVGPLHKCDIYQSREAGDKLRKMLSLGSSKPWPEAMEIMTGQRNMDAGPLLEYFLPLQRWLENENKDEDVSWKAECSSIDPVSAAVD